jgi:pyruvate/2-oxoglutarate dehydrogenase complex dihydrolipoamide dehydrogenase (E3) component
VVVLGGGSAGEAFVAALRRLDAGVPITVVERELLGGECTYFACMPSKTLLRATELLAAARIAPGVAEAICDPLDAERIFWWRDQVTDGLDDASHARWLVDRNVELVRGEAQVVEPGLVRVGDREIPYAKLVIATGSDAVVPEIPGLAGTEFWTSREATTASEVPESLLVLGGGAVGCELAQFYRRMGTRVGIVQREEHLLMRQDREAGLLLQRVFEEEGIEVHLRTEAARIDPGFRVELTNGKRVEAERLLVATGRRPNVEGFGFEKLGVRLFKKGVVVDERLQAAENVWAIGDVSGIALFTHVGKYQGRVAAVTVGQTSGHGLATATWKVNATARSSTYERPKRQGFLRVCADPKRRVVVGAVAVGPEAGEWIGQLTLAIRAEVPVDVIRDTIQPFPTFSEAVFFAVRELPL